MHAVHWHIYHGKIPGSCSCCFVFAVSLQQREQIVTQAEARGAILRAQAAAEMDEKYQFGQALDLSAFTGINKQITEI